MNPAIGRRVSLALARERRFGVPGTDALTFFAPVLPENNTLMRTEAPTGAVNASGFMRPSVPAEITGKSEWADVMGCARMLMFLEHLFGQATKTNPTAGVYVYTFTPNFDGPAADSSLWGYFAQPSVLYSVLYGIVYDEASIDIKKMDPLKLKLKGYSSHGTRLGLAEADAGNTGTYTLGPHLRGPIQDPADGSSVFVKVTRVIGGLQFKTERSSGVPTFPGAAVDVYINPALAEADWQNLQGATGLDLGHWDETGNRDPLEIIWPGTATDHADLAIGDIFEFKATAPALATAAPVSAQAFTPAHLFPSYRVVGAGVWIPFSMLEGDLKLGNKADPQTGASSRYYTSIFREGPFMPELKIKRQFVDVDFLALAEAHKRLEVKLDFQGRQLTAAYREGVVLTLTNAVIGKHDHNASGAKITDETIELEGQTDNADEAPLSCVVTTDYDWTPLA